MHIWQWLISRKMFHESLAAIVPIHVHRTAWYVAPMRDERHVRECAAHFQTRRPNRFVNHSNFPRFRATEFQRTICQFSRAQFYGLREITTLPVRHVRDTVRSRAKMSCMELTPHAARKIKPSGDQFAVLCSRVEELAKIINATTEFMPTYGESMQNGRAHIEIDGATYHFVREERGQEFERYSTTTLDEVLYRMFRDVTWSMASELARVHRKHNEDFRRELFKQQHALLARLNHEWMLRSEAEHARVLAKHPFVD